MSARSSMGRQWADPDPYDDETNPNIRSMVRVHHEQLAPDYHAFHAVSPAFYTEDGDMLRRFHYGTLRVEHLPDEGHVIHDIDVGGDHQGEGIGRKLYEAATAKLGPVKHSSHMTRAGLAFSKAVGGPHVEGPKTHHFMGE